MQTVLDLKDTSIATSVVLFFQILGAALLEAASQAVVLGQLIPRIQQIIPSLTREEIIMAGATGLRSLVPLENLRAVLVAYASSVSKVFWLSFAVTSVAVVMAFPIEWKSMNKDVKSVKGAAISA